MSTKEQLEQDRLSQERRNRRQATLLSGLLFMSVVALCFFDGVTIPSTSREQYAAVGFADLGEPMKLGRRSWGPREVIEEAVTEEVAASAPEPVVEESAEDIVTQEATQMPYVSGTARPEPTGASSSGQRRPLSHPGNPSGGAPGWDGVGTKKKSREIDGAGWCGRPDRHAQRGTMIGERGFRSRGSKERCASTLWWTGAAKSFRRPPITPRR